MKNSTPWAIKGLLIRPGNEPTDYFATNDLDDITMSALEAGGELTAIVTLESDLVMVYLETEEGVRPKRLPSAIHGDPRFGGAIHGNIFICRYSAVGFSSLKPGDKEKVDEYIIRLTAEDVANYERGDQNGK